MAELVGQHQQSIFTTPVNGTTGDAAQVLGNDNNLRSAYNAHDNDAGVHLQSGLHASRPAAGTQGRKWFSTDTKRMYYDNGTTWDEIAYLALAAGGTIAGAVVISAGGLQITGGLTVVDTGVTITAGGLVVTAGGATVTAGGLTVTAGNLLLNGGQAKAKRHDAGNSGTSFTIDWNNGNIQKVTLTGNVTAITLNNPQAGASYMLELLQDGTGSRTVTGWPAAVKWADGGTAPTVTSTANRKTVLVLTYNGTNYLGVIYGLDFADTA